MTIDTDSTFVVTRHPDRPRARRHGRRRAYVLVAVLALAALATSLGVSFLESNATAMPEAMNYRAQVRAQYIADSGAAMAAHFLAYPPTTVPVGQYWTGQASVSLDGSPDLIDVAVTKSATDPNRYEVLSVGRAKDPDGAVRAKRLITADVVAPVSDKWTFSQALLDRDVLNVISRVFITGSVHANGNIDISSGSSISGSTSSTGNIRKELTLGIFTNVCLFAQFSCGTPSERMPTGAAARYQNYLLNGRYHSAHNYNQYSLTTLNKPNADSLNAINMSATNPGRLISYTGGSLTLRANSGNVRLNGGLVVSAGDLILADAGLYEIIAEEGFPALVLAGNVRAGSGNATLRVTGPVLCTGDLDFDNKNNVTFEVTGTLIKTGTFANFRNDSTFNITWTSARSWLWDVEAAPKPFTVLSWREK